MTTGFRNIWDDSAVTNIAPCVEMFATVNLYNEMPRDSDVTRSRSLLLLTGRNGVYNSWWSPVFLVPGRKFPGLMDIRIPDGIMKSEMNRESSVATDPAEWLDSYGDALYRYAILRVGRVDVAEDLVQETLLSGLTARKNFAGQSSEQTWLTGILVRKICDYFRAKSRERPLHSDERETGQERSEFDERGHWVFKLHRWPGNPSQALENQEFWRVFADCLSKLPPPLSAAFSLRELDKLDTEEISQLLGISATNLGVRLYRARLSLRACLEDNWFKSSRR